MKQEKGLVLGWRWARMMAPAPGPQEMGPGTLLIVSDAREGSPGALLETLGRGGSQLPTLDRLQDLYLETSPESLHECHVRSF